jgi:hypothetical protein
MYRKLMLAAATAAGVVATSFVAAPAEAAPYRVIRWDVTRICQVWDYGVSRPWGAYTVLSKKKKTLSGALRAQSRLVRRHHCGW